MRGIGVLEDGYHFSEEALERGAPHFWWGPRKRAAYDRALARRGMVRRDREDDAEGSSDPADHEEGAAAAAVVAAGDLVAEQGEKRPEGSGSWFASPDGESHGGGSSGDSGGSSDGGGGSDGGGSSE